MCAEKQRLVDLVKRAIAELSRIHFDELEAVSRGDATLDGDIQHRLRTIREQRVSLLERLRTHLAEHHC